MDEGVFPSRSEVVRAGLAVVVDQQRRRGIGQAITEGYRRIPQRDEDLSWPEARLPP